MPAKSASHPSRTRDAPALRQLIAKALADESTPRDVAEWLAKFTRPTKARKKQK